MPRSGSTAFGADALRQELALLDEEVGLTTMRAPISGVVLTPHLQERVGASLEEGDLLLTVGRTDTLELEFGVDQRDVSRVRPGQQVRLRVDALPQRTFVRQGHLCRTASRRQRPSGPSIRSGPRSPTAMASSNLRWRRTPEYLPSRRVRSIACCGRPHAGYDYSGGGYGAETRALLFWP